MHVLVTGGAGFIGSHLVAALLARGDQVSVIDRFDDYYDPALKRRNAAAWADRVRLHTIDLADQAAVEGTLEGVDAVAHLAARPGVRASIQAPQRTVQNNVGATQVLLDAMRRSGVNRLVFASSSSVYGVRSAQGAFCEDDRLGGPVSPYAASKHAGELLCHAATATGPLQCTALRLFTVYGPRQRPEMAIHLFARRALAGAPIQRFGDGSSLRDYTYVGDIVRGMMAALDRPQKWRVINLGSGAPISLRDLLARLETVLGVELEVEVLPDQPGDVPATWANTARARAELGWVPQVPLDEGLAQFAQWLREET